jgi:hypothetical protein
MKPKPENYPNVNKYINALVVHWSTNGGPSNMNQAIAREMRNYFNWREKKSVQRMKVLMKRQAQHVNKDIRNVLLLKEEYNKLANKINYSSLMSSKTRNILNRQSAGESALRKKIYDLEKKYKLHIPSGTVEARFHRLITQLILFRNAAGIQASNNVMKKI